MCGRKNRNEGVDLVITLPIVGREGESWDLNVKFMRMLNPRENLELEHFQNKTRT